MASQRTSANPDFDGDFGATLRPVNQSRHAPGRIYDCQEIYELEKEKIFMKDWLCVARAEEFARSGDYVAFHVMDEPVIVARDEQGSLHAYSNMCAHRGVEVAYGRGNTQQFSCPYHGWSYDLTGCLTGAAHMTEAEGFDPTQCRLPPVRLAEWGGWVFVNFDDDGESFDDFIAGFAEDTGFLRMEDCRLAITFQADLECNWKLLVENAIDIYHSAVLHADTLGKHRGPAERYPFTLRSRGRTLMRYEGSPMTPGGESLVGRIPWLDDQPDNFALAAHLSPNVQLFARIDNVHPFVIWPLSLTSCRLLIYILFPTHCFDEPGFSEKARIYHDFWSQVVEEDRTMIQSLQRAMRAKRFRPGRMSKLEAGIHHILTDYLDRMFG